MTIAVQVYLPFRRWGYYFLLARRLGGVTTEFADAMLMLAVGVLAGSKRNSGGCDVCSSSSLTRLQLSRTTSLFLPVILPLSVL